MKTDLKPCPFCGAVAILDHPPTSTCWRVMCGDRACPIAPFAFGESKARLARRWNKRATEATAKRRASLFNEGRA